MNSFRHHPDGVIYIKKDGVIKQIPLAYFQTVYINYTLPEFFAGREYIQGISDRLFTSQNEIYLEHTTWEQGDVYINNFDDYISENITVSHE